MAPAEVRRGGATGIAWHIAHIIGRPADRICGSSTSASYSTTGPAAIAKSSAAIALERLRMPSATIRPESVISVAAGGLPAVERLKGTIDAVGVFHRLAALPHVVFFDSALRHPHLGRYSFVAADPVEWHTARPAGGDALAALGARIAVADAGANRLLPPFQGGWAGMFAYELSSGLEPVGTAAWDEFQLPAIAVGLYDVVIAFDHEQDAAWVISQGFPEVDPFTRRERALARLHQFKLLLDGACNPPAAALDSSREVPSALPMTELAPQHPVSRGSHLTSNLTADEYVRIVRRAIEYIHAGDVFQVNLAQRLLHPAKSSSIELYCRLREAGPAPFAGYLDGGLWQVASVSPERFLSVRDGRVETRPIKGTRPRGTTADADRLSAASLSATRQRPRRERHDCRFIAQRSVAHLSARQCAACRSCADWNRTRASITWYRQSKAS